MPQLTPRTLLALAARSASGVGEAVEVAPDLTLDLDLKVTAITGGTLTVVVETSKDSAVGWSPVVMSGGVDLAPTAFPLASTTGIKSVTFTDLKRFARVSWTLSAGASATFEVSGNGVRVYATPNDLNSLGLVPAVLASVSSLRRDAAIREQTDRIDSALVLQFEVPLDVWGYDIRGGCSACSACQIMATDGKRPGQDDLVSKRCAMFDEWLDLVADGKRRPSGAVDQTPSEDEGNAQSVTDSPRPWTGRYAW